MSLTKEQQRYLDLVPKLEEKLASDIPVEEKVEVYKVYENVLMVCAKYDFHCFNKYLELDEDARQSNKKFYHHRKVAFKEVFDALNDMEIHDKYDTLIINTSPRLGKTTSGLRFLSWIAGRHPLDTELVTSYSDNITMSMFNGVMEIVQHPRYKNIFPESPLVAQNVKREEIFLAEIKRYPSLMFVPIGASLTGRAEATRYLYMDDLVQNLEQALSLPRLNKLWEQYTTDLKQRKKDGAKEIMICTNWSVWDVATRIINMNADNPRCKVIKIPCYDENGESTAQFKGGFSTQYYRDLENTMDSASFSALYLQQPVEREGLLFHEDDLKYYTELPDTKPDAVIAVVDSKNLGKDYASCPIAYIYDNDVYIEDVVFDNGLPETVRPKLAEKLVKHRVKMANVEIQNGGNYWLEYLDKSVRELGWSINFRGFYTKTNKEIKIITNAEYVKTNFYFKHKSKYSKHSEYASFMKNVFSYTQTGKNIHDDAPDSLAMLAEMIQTMVGTKLKVVDRKTLRL